MWSPKKIRSEWVCTSETTQEARVQAFIIFKSIFSRQFDITHCRLRNRKFNPSWRIACYRNPQRDWKRKKKSWCTNRSNLSSRLLARTHWLEANAILLRILVFGDHLPLHTTGPNVIGRARFLDRSRQKGSPFPTPQVLPDFRTVRTEACLKPPALITSAAWTELEYAEAFKWGLHWTPQNDMRGVDSSEIGSFGKLRRLDLYLLKKSHPEVSYVSEN